MKPYIFLIFLCVIAACENKNVYVTTRSDLKDTIMQVDRDFSKMSVEKSISEAFISYAAEDVILMREKEYPVVGFDSLKRYYEKRKFSNAKLSWVPLKAEVNGDLGYTFGSWKLDAKADDGSDTALYGLYSTVWKKQNDGSWKYVLDCGNITPGKFTLNK